MKKQTWISRWKAVMTLLLLLTASQGFSQTYRCDLKNITYPTANTCEFEVWLENTGPNNYLLQSVQMGIEFNYAGMANGGVITGSFVAGSNNLPAPQNNLTPNTTVNATSKQIRVTASIQTSSAVAAALASPFRYGTFRLTNTQPMTPGATPNFIWSFTTASNRTKTAVSCWTNGATSGASITTQTTGGTPNSTAPTAPYAYIAGPQHFVESNPPVPTACPNVTAGTTTDPLCFGGTGSVEVNLSSASAGTYSVDGGTAQSFASGTSFTISGLSQGAHNIDVTPTGCAATQLSVTIGGPSSNATNTSSATACDSYTWSVNGLTYTQSGTYTGTSTDANGCTVNEVLNLTINNSTSNTSSATACDSYMWSVDGMTYTQSGTYTATSTNAAGCPHTETLNLTINNSTSNTSSATACDSYMWSVDGMTYTQSGTYTATSTNAAGCPHTETLNLTINNSTSGQSSATACDSYMWSCDGMTYTQSGTYTCNSTNAAGCPHVETLTLTINASTSNTSSATACDSYTWSVDGMTYTASGTYTATSTNTAGCPHTETLNLTINNSTSNTSSATACDSYTWSVDGMTYTQSGTYTAASTNAAGCPHTETLNLTINNSTSGQSSATACDSYTWSCNGMTYTQSGTYTCASTNAAGCPHTETLTLTINASTSNTSSATACDSYTWSVDGMTYTASGTYTATSTNTAGCPHTETLNLTINNSTSSTSSVTACDSYTWSVNGMTYTQSGTYTFVTPAAGTPLPYCAASATCDEFIGNVTIGAINNSSTCSGGYADYTAMSTAVTAGSSYSIDVTNGNHYSGDQVAVWVDWNQDGDFADAGEAQSITYANPISNGSIAVPANATNGNTRMRVRITYTGAIPACGSVSWGETEDYTLTVSGGIQPLLCPHTDILVLTINNSTSNASTATACDTYTWTVNGMTYTQSGTYTATSTNAAGCTHTEILYLTITPSTTNTTSATACDSYTWSVNGMTYTASGTYTNVTNQTTPAYCSAGATNNGCTTGDEYINNVTIGSINNNSNCGVGMYEDYTSLSTAVSAGSSYAITVGNANHFLGDQVHVWCDWNQNGSFSDPGENYVLGYTPNLGSGTIAVPNGANNGNTRMRIRLNWSGVMDPCGIASYGEVEDYTLVVSGGSSTATVCTHTEILNLTINNSTSNTSSATACDSYTWSVDGMTYTQSGTYTATSTNAAGCPHTETLNLTINNSTSGQSSATACDSYMWSADGMTYTQSGTYTATSTNAAGCPHTETLNLTINNSTSNTTSATACDSYTWSVDGNTYTASGTYTSTSTNTAGCPHTETLNLTINASTSNTSSATACDSYTWSVDGMTYTQSGTYTATSTNAAGCPHTETLNLTINSSTSNTTSETACGTYTWSCNGMTYTQSGTYTCTSTNSAGCTHTEILVLTITPGNPTTTTISSCVSYTWACDGMTYTQSGTYTCGTGCNASILILTINPLPVVTAPNVGSCGGAVTLGGSPAGGTWNLPNPYTGNATSYTYFYTDANGCTGSATGTITAQSATVTNLQISAITGITATATWTGTAPWYEIRWKVIGAGSWNPTVTSTSPNKNITGLSPATNYTVEVRGFCTTSTPGSWVGTTFTTNTGCGTPTGLNVTNITATTSKLNWTAVAGASYYNVRHRKVGATSWINGTSTPNSKTIGALLPNTNYEFQVQAVCGSSLTAWSASQTWTTSASRDAVATEVATSSNVNIYPNPTQNELNVDLTVEQSTIVTLKMVDMSGRVVKQVQANAEVGVNNMTMNLSDLSNGIYSLQIYSNDQLTNVTRVTKN